MDMIETTDIAIIGAGPAGTIAAALLRRYGYRVTIVEKMHFPRFSIGESLLPQCMQFIEQARMTTAVEAAGFQHKNGATFVKRGAYAKFDFRQKFSPGHGTTFQVPRANFDKLLADQAEQAGTVIHYGCTVLSLDYDAQQNPLLTLSNGDEVSTLGCRFVLDASGFGRVLPRLLSLETPSHLPVRMSVFTHVEDHIDDHNYERDKILIAIHPQRDDVWYWLIPFSNGRASVGVVAEAAFFEESQSARERLNTAIDGCSDLAKLLVNANFDSKASSLIGYSTNVKALWGKGYALLGNAGEFLDPVFSSGVTIAMKSASLVAPLLRRHLQDEAVDWDKEFEQPLRLGIETFKAYVDAWYDGEFQKVIFSNIHMPQIREMICSILAGYAWDTNNPYVKDPRRRLATLVEHCQ